MAPTEFFMWGLCLILVFAHYQGAQGEESIPGLGINWGALASHTLNPNVVVNMLKDNGIKKVKLFDADSWTLSALSGTDIEVMVGIPNDQLSKFAGSSGDAEAWVRENLTKHIHNHHGSVNIRYGGIKFLHIGLNSYMHQSIMVNQITFSKKQNVLFSVPSIQKLYFIQKKNLNYEKTLPFNCG